MSSSIKSLKDALKKGVITFQFKKKDGSIRTTKGTTNHEIISSNYTPKGGSGPAKYGYTSYWDVDKNDWRCFNNNNLIGLVSE